MSECSPGWAKRCAASKGIKCACACGGKNHGHKVQKKEEAELPMQKEEKEMCECGFPQSTPPHEHSMPDGFIVGSQDTREVFISGRRLDPRRSQKLWNHSPDGFNWGYFGSGPAQTALAILLEMGVDDQTAVKWHQTFKADIIAGLESDFKLPISTVTAWINNRKEVVK